MTETPKKTTTFVATVNISIAAKLKQDLIAKGFEISQPDYTVFAARSNGVSCTLYQSGKLMVQGKNMHEFIEFYLEPEILQSFAHSYKDLNLNTTPRIGVDESGKGDFFGPLCIAGVYAQGKEIARMQELGVCDSKKLSDVSIVKIGKKIQQEFSHHIVKISPKKYNELYEQFHNLNRLLAWGHATVIEKIATQTGCQRAVIDQFADEHVVLTAVKRKNLDIQLEQRHRAEEDLVVAAASILARMTFVEEMKKLSEEFGIELPKGASQKVIQAGKQLVQKFGSSSLPLAGKMHFKTSQEILN